MKYKVNTMLTPELKAILMGINPFIVKVVKAVKASESVLVEYHIYFIISQDYDVTKDNNNLKKISVCIRGAARE
jgi:hypothetical protein